MGVTGVMGGGAGLLYDIAGGNGMEAVTGVTGLAGTGGGTRPAGFSLKVSGKSGLGYTFAPQLILRFSRRRRKFLRTA